MSNHPRVGVGVIIFKDSKILLGKRKNATGWGTWACPGGALEFGESLEACAMREVLEETGIRVLSVKKYGLTNDVFAQEGKHFLTIFMMADAFEGDPENCEPEKCDGWQWYALDALPEPLFLPLKNLIAQGMLAGGLECKQWLLEHEREWLEKG